MAKKIPGAQGEEKAPGTQPVIQVAWKKLVDDVYSQC